MFDRVRTYIPYCFRTKTNVSTADPIRNETFASMYEDNRTIADIYFQYASLDTIEDYEIYTLYRRLNRSNPISGEQFYQQCEPPAFGNACQYQFLFNGKFLDIVKNTFNSKRFDQPGNIYMITNGTCYQELQCQGSIICLDWREICDGYDQCFDGHDEEYCQELEMNECDPITEYRCNNGQCIPQELFFDRIPDCLDKSDENYAGIEFCHATMHWYCENSMCDSTLFGRIYGTPMPFTCGDGQCRELSNINQIRPTGGASSLICGSGRDILFTQQLFSSDDDCTMHMKCVLKYYLFQKECVLKCSSQYRCLSLLKNVCGNRSYVIFPSKPIFHNHVFFIYRLDSMTLSLTNYLPSLICFDSKRCSQYYTTINLNDKNCSTIDQFEEFRQLDRSINWIDIYVALYVTFGRCALPGLLSYHHSSLFHCSNTSKCISRHRIQDGTVDCFMGEDEIDLSMCDQLPHRFHCHTDQRCIPRRFLMDFEMQCTDGSDEALGFRCMNSLSENCDIVAGRRDTNKESIFTSICNGIEEIRLGSEENDTDETDCSEYSCMSRYTLCNGVWNCVDGRDELFCDNVMSSIHCNVTNNEFFCLQLINETVSYCASVNKINDSQINCLGSSDERDFCRKKYPFDYIRRYKCENSSMCISPLQICDCHQDCPLNDDEEWPLCAQTITQCPTRFFPCSDVEPGKFIPVERSHRCDGEVKCIMSEDEWLCDLIDQSEVNRFTSKNLLDFVSILPKNVQQSSSRSLKFNWYCNRGIPVKSTVNDEEIKCLCSPAYYGDRCEYQRKRLNVILELRASTMVERTSVFKLLIFLVHRSTGNFTYSTEIIYLPTVECLPKHIIDLLYPFSWQITDQHYVHISIYHLTQQNRQIHYQGSWLFSIHFEFLPVNRLVTQITLTENSNPKILDYCEHLPCVNGRCESYLNRPDHYFCHCTPPWFGRLCDHRKTDECSCAPDSICITTEICLCPLEKVGSRCFVPFDPCQTRPCGEHGTCLPSDIRTNQWICVCHEKYFGNQCQYNASILNVDFAPNIRIPSAVLVHFFSLSNTTEKEVRSYFRPISLRHNKAVVFYPDERIPNMILVQLFDGINTDLLHLVLLNNYDDTLISYEEIHVEVSKMNECPVINKIFGSKFAQLPFLRRVKFYQRPCQNGTTRVLCFYDDMHICLCNKFQQVDCIPFIITNSTAQCPTNANPCKNDGICRQDEKRCPKASICVCPACTFGRLCQFSVNPYSLSLEVMIGQFIKPNIKFYQQPGSILMAVIITGVMCTLGIIDVGLCMITFSQASIRSSGRGFYLLCLSLVNLGTMSVCLTQLVRLLIEKTNNTSSYRGCLVNHFLLKAFPIASNWIQTCASVENICIVYYGLSYRKELSYRAAKYIVIGILLMSCLMCIHDPFYRNLLYDTFEQQTWCVVSFRSKWLKTYDSMMITIHYIAPFSINIFSSIAVIVLTARIRAKTNKKYRKTLWKNLEENKHLLISPTLLALFTIPRQIIAWLTTCMIFNGRSQPYWILTGFYVGYLPNILSTVVFIIPSRLYREKLIQALQRSIRRIK